LTSASQPSQCAPVVAAIDDSAQLTALSQLLKTARDLVAELADDANTAKLMQAFARLDPQERAVIATAFERGVTWRKVNESLAPINRVHLKPNPNARFFVRVVDPPTETGALPPDPDELLVGTVRILRHAHRMATPEAIAVWEPALRAALDLLEPEERHGCAAVVQEFLRILGSLPDPPGAPER
jgi:hypothetical protein